jgi:hypothetical protein
MEKKRSAFSDQHSAVSIQRSAKLRAGCCILKDMDMKDFRS